MVVGNGMIATAFNRFATDAGRLIFASGVSNSSTLQQEQFDREENLLRRNMAQHPDKQLIYFSTCSIYDASMQQSAYVKHKLAMEQCIQKQCNSYLIFRVSNPVGITRNPHTVLNYFVQHIKNGTAFSIWKNAERNLIDLSDMVKLCSHILLNTHTQNSMVNIANTGNYSVAQIVAAIEQHFHQKARATLLDTGSSPIIDTSFIEPMLATLGISFDKNYLHRLLQKYFPLA